MKWLNGHKKNMVLAGFVITIAFSGGKVKADFTFGEPVNLGPPVNTSESWTGEPAISADGLELYFISERSGGQGLSDIWITTRPTKNDPWGEPENLGPVVNSSAKERGPCITADGLELYFASKISGKWYLYVSTRPTKDGEWGNPVKLPNNPSFGVDSASVSGDGLELYYSFYYNDGWYEVHVMKRETTNDPWPRGERIGSSINDWSNDMASCVSYDGSAIFYARGGGKAPQYELFMSTRISKEDPWKPCISLSAINISPGWDYAPCVSADGSMLYFESDRSGSIGGADLWQTPIIPIVDFNSDGKVDVKDVVILTEHWGESYSLCDIGPMPWGDGIVDFEDLKVLIDHIIPTPLAHWKLDEVEGIFAVDSAGDNEAIVAGGATWLPNDGQVDGALQLDGISGCAITEYVLNPSYAPFSIFAWIKTAIPGKVIVSQQAISDWLAVSADGKLMTDLKDLDGLADPLISETVITDGQWYRIGLVWNGSRRILYVDGDAVAEDTLAGLEGSQMGLYIGVDKNYTPDTFFAGMIDDVRIYNVALSAEQIEGLSQ